jgi:hypothetical protein
LRHSHQRQCSAFALVIEPQQQKDVLYRDDQNERPEDEGDDADDIGPPRRRLTRHVFEREPERVERARTDVAEHYAQ